MLGREISIPWNLKSSLLLGFLLDVVKVLGISHIIDVSGLDLTNQTSMVSLTMLQNSLTQVALVLGMVETSLELFIDGNTSILGK